MAPYINGTMSNSTAERASNDGPPSTPPKFLVIGAGSRGNAYGGAVTRATPGVIHAVAEIDPFKRRKFGRKYIWGDGSPKPGQEFASWTDWLEWETARRGRKNKSANTSNGFTGEDKHDGFNDGDGVDGVFVCTLDEMHVQILLAIAPLNLHILCEKPLATSLDDCLAISKAIGSGPSCTPSKVFSIGHVLRYSPHNILLRKLLLADSVIGDIVSLEHTEPVGWWHFSHSYVRGNWRRESPQNDGSLLTKCSHDIDFILWLLCSPPPGSSYDHPYHFPKSISSMGSLTQFRQSRKPLAAGASTNCLTCPAEKDCIYSALKIYRDSCLLKGKTGWPVKIVCPDIEDTLQSSGLQAAETQLLQNLAEDYDKQNTPDSKIAARPWFGRCVYESDNSVCDDQVVTMSWDDDPLPVAAGDQEQLSLQTRLRGRGAKIATLHMIAPTEAQCERRGRVYGTHGEVSYDSKTISVYEFKSRETRVVPVPKQAEEALESHGGGDHGLARAFVKAVDAVENYGWDLAKAQAEFVGCTFEEALRSHATVFAAEEARRQGRVVDWKSWWAEKVNAQ